MGSSQVVRVVSPAWPAAAPEKESCTRGFCDRGGYLNGKALATAAEQGGSTPLSTPPPPQAKHNYAAMLLGTSTKACLFYLPKLPLFT